MKAKTELELDKGLIFAIVVSIAMWFGIVWLAVKWFE